MILPELVDIAKYSKHAELRGSHRSLHHPQLVGDFARHGWLVDVHMGTGRLTRIWISSLAAFWPGMQALIGEHVIKPNQLFRSRFGSAPLDILPHLTAAPDQLQLSLLYWARLLVKTSLGVIVGRIAVPKHYLSWRHALNEFVT